MVTQQNRTFRQYHRLRNRWYSPGMGRFVSRDPATDGWNWYAFENGTPSTENDPMGLFPVPIPDIDLMDFGLGAMLGDLAESIVGMLPFAQNYLGYSGTMSYYIPLYKGSKAGATTVGVYVSGEGASKAGECCENGKKRHYMWNSFAFSAGGYAGGAGFRGNLLTPSFFQSKKCPKAGLSTTGWNGNVGLTSGFARFGCTINRSGISNCSMKFGVRFKDEGMMMEPLNNIRITIGATDRAERVDYLD